MKIFLHANIYVALYCLGFPVSGDVQSTADSTASSSQYSSSKYDIFESNNVLEITLSGNIRELMNDRSETPKYHPIHLLYRGEDSSEISIPAEAKTRGHFRKLKENCFYPPLLLHFSKTDTLKSSLFKGQDKLKLVMPCRQDEFVIREWLIYKLYNLVTQKSFRARIVRVKLEDIKNGKIVSVFYSILLEGEKQMAKRNGTIMVKRKIKPEQTDQRSFITMAVFQYLIANTDWSVEYMQNIKLLALDSNAVATAVPYDFDHAGLVNAPYAKPAEELNLNSVRIRRYRGYCMQDLKFFDDVITLYNRLKKDIYSIYTDCTLLDEKYKQTTIKYLDEFYATINNAVKVKKEFGYPCNKNGTGNVIIKGLRDE